ncbi:MAG: polysaccharide export protein [Alteromonadaceae bacterium TMED7]|nr:MAG: polysaccharide export protein [Alteromonadaceae bacterium TMED7]|tara:strand:- start:8417 stop:8962 length:546 start_codon:yes stop_codon:yes gene_type:complete
MLKLLKSISLAALAIVSVVVSVCSAQELADYKLGTGDTIRIQVHGEEDLSFETRIGGDGTIRYPFLGDIKVTGRTVAQVRWLIADGLKGDYLDDPSVNVSVIEYRPFFILGEVKNPQHYAYQPGLTVRQAIAIAGGMTERASDEKIELKRFVNGELTVIQNVQLDMAIEPGDTITIAQSFF